MDGKAALPTRILVKKEGGERVDEKVHREGERVEPGAGNAADREVRNGREPESAAVPAVSVRAKVHGDGHRVIGFGG